MKEPEVTISRYMLYAQRYFCITLGLFLGFCLGLLLGSQPAHGTTTDTCVSLPEARSVVAGERVRHMLHRVAPDHATPRYHTKYIRDIDGCGRGTVFRYRFELVAGNRQMVTAWKFLSCHRQSECVVVTQYP